ncbi:MULTISPECIES: thiol:disulfide interchange protein DsbA/DsbL [Marinobacter]|uniref:thiol:disulfide interchange protein DsbA/DsbL n=1 Tax=Marinobacter TaxID=2742 RepID=UPI000DAD76FA|nr:MULTISPECIES: thiol:disulfide interchange protein DsbA/DsbL [Marinobacter]
MSKFWKGWLCALLLLPLAATVQAAEWQEGKDYQRLDSPIPTRNPDHIEVTEVFWYGCPHCYAFKPLIENWAAQKPSDVDFVLVPAALGRLWEVHARAFYTTQALDVLSKTHDAMFDALARDHKRLTSAEDIGEFLTDYGVDKDRFVKTFNSFGVNAKMQQAQSFVRAARITGVPTMIVNGKYKVTASMAGSHENMIKVIDYLVEKERNAN